MIRNSSIFTGMTYREFIFSKGFAPLKINTSQWKGMKKEQVIYESYGS